MRHSPSDDPVYSYAAVSGIKSSRPIQNLTIRMKEFEEIQIDRPCWHPLIPHAVIAKGFPIRHRKAGKGLDISFADMALLSQSMSFTEYDEGLIVEGLRSVLIPMEFLHQDDAIQWHLEYKRQKKAPKKRSISQIFATAPVPEWYKSQEPDELFHKRCFLGWTEEVSVMIGTLEFSGPRVYRSDAGPPPRTRRVKSHNISMGASCLGIVGANGSKTWEEASMPSSVTLEIHKDIHDTLADDSNATVLIYDPGEKTAWLLPQPSVVLYLTHKILAKRKYQLFDGDRETEFKFAEPGRDGAREASYILHEIIDFKVQKSSKFREDLSKTVKQICYQLDVLGDRLALATSEFERIGGGEGNNLYGFELNEMLGMTTSINIKQVRIEQPWTHVVRKRGIVLFCAGFGQAIVPATRSLEKLCATYQRVPPNRNLLATTGAVLHAFLEPLDQGPPGCTLGRRVEWLQDKFLLQSHTHGQRTSVFHEQSLQIVENSAPDPSMLGSLGCYLSSGFIFTGHRSRVACSEVMISPTSTSPSWAPENVLDEAKPDSNLTQEDSGSDISHETDSGFNSGNMATSSLIGDELPPTEKELDQVIQPLATATTSSTWGTKDSQPDSAYVIGPFPSRETSMASSSSNTPRTVKNNDGCVDLATVVDKGKKPTSETEGSVWKLGGSSFKRMAQKAFAKPTELSGSDAETLSKEIKNIDLGSGKAKRRRH